MSERADQNYENLIQIALQLNHIRNDQSSLTSPYNCNVCMVPFSGVEPLRQHLISAKHKKKIVEREKMSDLLPILSPKDCSFEKSRSGISTLQNNSAQSVNFNSSQVQDAFNKGYIIGDLGSATSPFQCKACNVTVTGLAPLKDHVASAKHIKKTIVFSGGTNSSNFAASSMGGEADALSKSFDLGHVRRASDSFVGAYFCEICQAPLSGEDPLRQHINSPNHAKKLKNKESAFDISGLQTSLSNIGTTEISSIVMKAIEDGHVCNEGRSLAGAYFCNVCNVPLTGEKPLEQHLQGSSHSKKLNVSPYKENSPSNAISTIFKSSVSRDLFSAQTSFQPSQQLPEEIADILVIHAHEPVDKLFN